MVYIWLFNPVSGSALFSFCAFHVNFLFFRSQHPLIITVLLFTDTKILCSPHLALHYTFRSCLSRVITSSKNILFWCLVFSKFLQTLPHPLLLSFLGWGNTSGPGPPQTKQAEAKLQDHTPLVPVLSIFTGCYRPPLT